MNVLFVTLDQFRADAYGAAGHPLVQTPTLDRIAREGVAPRAPLLPGRPVLAGARRDLHRHLPDEQPGRDQRHAAAGRASTTSRASRRRAGYDPTLFGYTDQGLDPMWAAGDDDPRLDSYDGVLPGLSVGLYLPESQAGWIQWLRARGYDVPYGWAEALRGEPDRPAEDSLAGFLTDRFLEWLGRQDCGLVRPPELPAPAPALRRGGGVVAPLRPRRRVAADRAGRRRRAPPAARGGAGLPPQRRADRRARDAPRDRPVPRDGQRGRRRSWGASWPRSRPAASGTTPSWSSTADHGEQLGDHGLIEKLGFFPQSYHVVGLWRDPRRSARGVVVDRFTENVDLLPTLAEALGLDAPAQCDGRSLSPLLDGADAPWRDGRRTTSGTSAAGPSCASRRAATVDWALATNNLAPRWARTLAYVQFGDGSWLAFDLAADPTWRTACADEGRVLDAARSSWSGARPTCGASYTDMLLRPGRPGRWPDPVGRALGQTA